MTSEDSDSTTSSAGSEAGRLPSSSPNTKTSSAGRGQSRASRSRSQASAPVQMTLGISGPPGSGSSESAALAESLANRCRELSALDGSMEYRQTWREKATPLGRSYWAHTASARKPPLSLTTLHVLHAVRIGTTASASCPDLSATTRRLLLVRHTSGSGSGGWPTPTALSFKDSHQPGTNRSIEKTKGLIAGWPTPIANEDNKSPKAHSAMKKRMGGGRKAVTSLQVMAKIAGWPSPRANKWGEPDSHGNAPLTGWSTPQTNEPNSRERPSRKATGRTTEYLGRQAQIAGWRTPAESDGERGAKALRSSDDRIALNDQTAVAGWATPREADAKKNIRTAAGAAKEAERKGGNNDLGTTAALTGWPTPNTPKSGRGLQRNPEKALERKARGHMVNLDDAAVLAGWPTPNVLSENALRAKTSSPVVALRRKSAGHQFNLQDAAALAGWPSPQASPGGPEPAGRTGRKLSTIAGWATLRSNAGGTSRGNPKRAHNRKARIEDQVHLFGWATPTSRDHKDGAATLENTPVNSFFSRQVKLAKAVGWHTPTANDRKSAGYMTTRGKTYLSNLGVLRGPTMPSSPAETERRGALASRFSGWMMGYPFEWWISAPTKRKK